MRFIPPHLRIPVMLTPPQRRLPDPAEQAIVQPSAQEISMSNLATLKTARIVETDEWQLRVDLAAAFRLAAMFDWHEAVANHLSLAVSADGKKFLMNPRWKHFSRIKASELMLLDSNDKETMNRPDAPDLTAWSIHGRMHANVPQARCIIHLHPHLFDGAGLARQPRHAADRPEHGTILQPHRLRHGLRRHGQFRRRGRPPGQPARQQADHDDGQPWRAHLRLDRGRGLRPHLSTSSAPPAT